MGAPENPPAFPSTEEHPSYDIPMHHFGMTLRDWFAGQALAGEMAAGTTESWLRIMAQCDEIGTTAPEYVAKAMYSLADAMLTERSKA